MILVNLEVLVDNLIDSENAEDDDVVWSKCTISAHKPKNAVMSSSDAVPPFS